MGVKACSRNNCGEIMCDTYIPSIGYICYDCIKEFKNTIDYETNSFNECEIKTKLNNFMNTQKGLNDDIEINLDDFFNKHTG